MGGLLLSSGIEVETGCQCWAATEPNVVASEQWQMPPTPPSSLDTASTSIPEVATSHVIGPDAEPYLPQRLTFADISTNTKRWHPVINPRRRPSCTRPRYRTRSARSPLWCELKPAPYGEQLTKISLSPYCALVGTDHLWRRRLDRKGRRRLECVEQRRRHEPNLGHEGKAVDSWDRQNAALSLPSCHAHR